MCRVLLIQVYGDIIYLSIPGQIKSCGILHLSGDTEGALSFSGDTKGAKPSPYHLLPPLTQKLFSNLFFSQFWLDKYASSCPHYSPPRLLQNILLCGLPSNTHLQQILNSAAQLIPLSSHYFSASPLYQSVGNPN